MADIIDVENAIVSFIANVLYPSGSTPNLPSVIGPICKVYRGWPVPASLDTDLKAGLVNVSVFTESGGEKNTTRYPQDWQTLTPASPKVTLGIVNNVVTVGGSIQTGDFACVKVGARNVYSVPVASNSTTASIAAALAAAIAANYPGTIASGTVITIPTGQLVQVAVGGQGTAWKEINRAQQIVQVTMWCPTPAVRDLIGPFLRVSFASIERLALADNGSCRVYYNRSIITDKNETQQCFRRDVFLTTEFPISITQSFPSIGAFVSNVTGGVSPADTPTPVQTVT